MCLPHAPDGSAIVYLIAASAGYELLDVGETIAARGMLLTR